MVHIPGALSRVDTAKSQVGQTGSQRRKNLSQAFTVNLDSTSLPKNIILVDDVITTGSTINTISKLLKTKGVQSITAIAVALTLPK